MSLGPLDPLDPLDPTESTVAGPVPYRLAATVATKALAFAVGAVIFAIAASGFGWSWASIAFACGAAVFGLAVVPGFELMSGLGVLGLFATLVVRMHLASLSVARAFAMGTLLLVWALLAQLGETLADEPGSRPLREPLKVWLREAGPLVLAGLVAGAFASAAAAVALSTSFRIDSTVAILLAVTAPVLLLMALVFAWRWRDPGNQPPRRDDDYRY